MKTCEPCLCGDPYCGRCFPQSRWTLDDEWTAEEEGRDPDRCIDDTPDDNEPQEDEEEDDDDDDDEEEDARVAEGDERTRKLLNE